ncbi:DoxX family protein [Nocardia rosealba]|uniref:DoxX family protein n=1 Tax=Nocardia rosealba TaxID=2878563 RepID=UPI001CD957E3|nr:DoxX family protein [Nocardia rosealba]MCA2207369.1 DoxX family protein [Nocardia rosealba]
MNTAYVVVTVLAALAALLASGIDVFRADWVRENMREYGLPTWALPPLAVIKAAGGIGLLAGLAYRPLAVAAAAGLVLYFIGAEITVVLTRCYSHVAYPLPYLLLAGASLTLAVA